MAKISDYFVIYVAFNEEKTLLRSFLATKKAIEFFANKKNNETKAHVIICHNGCIDSTPEIAQEIKEKYASKLLAIDVICSNPRGMVIAQHKCIDFIRQKRAWLNRPIIFMDADALMAKDLIFRFIEQFNRHPKIMAVGAQPLPIPYRGWRIDKVLLDKILNCRAYFPKSEIAVNYAPQFHPYAASDSQKIGSEFEKKSKIYFHGRCFALRNQSIWDVPKDSIGEDTYLDRSIHYRFGPGSIRHLYDAKVKFYPVISFADYIRARYRIYKDLNDLRAKNARFDKCREFSKTKLDWSYINSLSLRWRCAFVIYYAIRRFSNFIFKHNLIYQNKEIGEIWRYKQKIETT